MVTMTNTRPGYGEFMLPVPLAVSIVDGPLIAEANHDEDSTRALRGPFLEYGSTSTRLTPT